MRDEKEFFCECIRQHEKSMYALAFSILKNENDAADMFDDAILKLLNDANTLTGDLGGKATTMEVAREVINNLNGE